VKVIRSWSPVSLPKDVGRGISRTFSQPIGLLDGAFILAPA